MKLISTKFNLLIGIATIALLLPPLVNAAPKSERIEFWAQSDESNVSQINQSDLQTILSKYVVDNNPSGINRFNYAAMTELDKKILRRYIRDMQAIDPRKYAQKEQKSYWINLYNALTINLVLEAYPIESITKLGKGFFSFGPWDDELILMQKQSLSLNNIEHGILRPIWNDNRIHYAVNCASLGCPNIQKQIYTATNTSTLLDQAARDYVNHARGVHFKGKKLVVSSIYHWYRDDFGKSDSNVIKHLIKYAEPTLKQMLLAYSGTFDHTYDWRINTP